MENEYDVPTLETMELATAYKVGNSNSTSNSTGGDEFDW